MKCKQKCHYDTTKIDHLRSSLVFDVKGELWAVTARYRKEVLGHQIMIIDPLKLPLKILRN